MFKIRTRGLLFSWSGIKIAGGRSVLGADFGIFVKKVLSGGAADFDGKHRNYVIIRLPATCPRTWHKARVDYKLGLLILKSNKK